MCSGLFIINEVSESALEKEEIWPPGRTRKLSFGGKHLWPPASAAAGADGRSLDSASSRAEESLISGLRFRVSPALPVDRVHLRWALARGLAGGPSRHHGVTGGWGTARGEPAHGEARGARLSLQGPSGGRSGNTHLQAGGPEARWAGRA